MNLDELQKIDIESRLKEATALLERAKGFIKNYIRSDESMHDAGEILDDLEQFTKAGK